MSSRAGRRPDTERPAWARRPGSPSGTCQGPSLPPGLPEREAAGSGGKQMTASSDPRHHGPSDEAAGHLSEVRLAKSAFASPGAHLSCSERPSLLSPALRTRLADGRSSGCRPECPDSQIRAGERGDDRPPPSTERINMSFKACMGAFKLRKRPRLRDTTPNAPRAGASAGTAGCAGRGDRSPCACRSVVTSACGREQRLLGTEWDATKKVSEAGLRFHLRALREEQSPP